MDLQFDWNYVKKYIEHYYTDKNIKYVYRQLKTMWVHLHELRRNEFMPFGSR
jgi:hypothetical protein